jgi:hypothetical protein
LLAYSDGDDVLLPSHGTRMRRKKGATWCGGSRRRGRRDLKGACLIVWIWREREEKRKVHKKKKA